MILLFGLLIAITEFPFHFNGPKSAQANCLVE